MDLPEFLIGLLPVVAVGFVCIVAFRRRHDRRHSSPMILNPYTLVIERNADALGQPPVVQPGPETTRSQEINPPLIGLDEDAGRWDGPITGSSSPKKR